MVIILLWKVILMKSEKVKLNVNMEGMRKYLQKLNKVEEGKKIISEMVENDVIEVAE